MIGAGRLLPRSPGPSDGSFHPFAPWGQDQFGPQVLQELAPLHAHRVGHGQDEAVALGGRTRRPGRCRCCRWSAPRSGFRESRRPSRFGRLDHGRPDAVLDAAERVYETRAWPGWSPPGRASYAVQPHQRGVAYVSMDQLSASFALMLILRPAAGISVGLVGSL